MYFYKNTPMTEIRHYRHEICCLSPSRSTKKSFLSARHKILAQANGFY